MTLKKVFTIPFACLFFAGCSATPNQGELILNERSGDDPVKVALVNSANSISESLSELSLMKQAERYGDRLSTKRISLEVDDPELRTPVTLVSSRPTDAEHLARRLTSYIDYQFLVFGRRGFAPVLVTPKFEKTPLVDAYTEIGVMAGARADILIDEYAKTITFQYNNK